MAETKRRKAVQADPLETLREMAKEANICSLEFARELDSKDELAEYRKEFHIPKCPPHTESDPEAVYFTGNSLGPLPRSARAIIEEELKKWELEGVEGHFRGKRPWAEIDACVTGMMAEVVGAASASEVAVMNSLTVNLQLLLTAFYRPTDKRFKILIEGDAFCSDHHAVRSQIRLHGLDPETALIQLRAREGEKLLRTEDIVAAIEKEGDSVAVVLLGAVQFYTGQWFDMKRITEAGHAAGCVVGFDCAHAVGNVPLQLHDWNVDFACWCTYKYLNAGPGCIGGAFVHSKHNSKTFQELPRLTGWWGQECKDRFSMKPEWVMKEGAQSFQMSNPAVLCCLTLEASLKLFQRAGMDKLRAKSLRLTGYLEMLINQEIPTKTATIITPRDPGQRGCQLSVLFHQKAKPINDKLIAEGVICDLRRPDVIRISPAPMFNSFEDVYKSVVALKKVLSPEDV